LHIPDFLTNIESIRTMFAIAQFLKYNQLKRRKNGT